jgi:hypothetical protein
MDHRHPIGSPCAPSVIHALQSVGETTTIGVVVFSLQHYAHHFGDVGYEH